MDKYLRPDKFDADPTANLDQAHVWTHWKTTFENFISAVDDPITDLQKYKLLVNFLSPSVFKYIKDCKTYEIAIAKLDQLFIKPINEVSARHRLMKRTQKSSESIDQYMMELRILAKQCNFKKVTAEENENEYIRDAFISGLISSSIRQRLLENYNIQLDAAYNQACSLEFASTQNDTMYKRENIETINSADINNPVTASVNKYQNCYYCGNKRHLRRNCPAYNSVCLSCGKKGHFATVCKNKFRPNINTTSNNPIEREEIVSCTISAADLTKAIVPITINNYILARALIDTGSTASFIDKRIIEHYKLKKIPLQQKITMAKSDLTTYVYGKCSLFLKIQSHTINADFLIMDGLCSDVIIGHDILRQHENLKINFGGSKPSLVLQTLYSANIEPVKLFSNLLPFNKPVAIKSRRYSEDDCKFIECEIQKLLQDKIIEPSQSPWRAQVLITSNENHKKRMVIDYSQTINKFTLLDAYPIPSIEDMITKIGKFRVFSKIDLKSAYHQIPISKQEKPYTAFEACGNLYQFTRIPFGVTNGVAAFQRAINSIISTEKLQGTYAYLDDITICGESQEDHDKKLQHFKEIAQKYRLTLNVNKSEFSKSGINILGYNIRNGVIKPDPDRLKPLLELPVPTNSASLRRCLGMFAHYAKWIPNFSSKVKHLTLQEGFPMSNDAIEAFKNLKLEIAKSAVIAIDHKQQLTVETDASDFAIAATLSQGGKPVAFFSRMLSGSERSHSAIEKEAAAIVESIRKWRPLLIGKTFRLITDQKSVSFMFNQKHNSRIKNDKIQRWRLELSIYDFEIVYRPGTENIVADAFSRVNNIINAMDTNLLMQLHKNLCHPGVTRMVHWIRSKNLPFSVDEIRRVTAQCQICAEIKPRFLRTSGSLIKATVPFERISMDFKGPLPSQSPNKYILTIVDEFSRFPFAFPCSDLSANTVKNKLISLFAIFGLPMYIHSDRGTAFFSNELKEFLHKKGIATSYSSPYNPQGNGQTERYNGIIWKTIQLALRTQNLPITAWESVITESLHSIRSLLCTATGVTPHERMFLHPRRSSNGQSIPSWLTEGKKALMKNNVRYSKYDPLVEEVEIIAPNPLNSQVRLQSGREIIVSNRHLAPPGLDDSESLPIDNTEEPVTEELEMEEGEISTDGVTDMNGGNVQQPNAEETDENAMPLRRSDRIRRPPARFADYCSSS